MHCLIWWLPIFLLPLSAASPFLCLLFIVTYAVRMRPCAYCSIIIVGLLFSTCTLYSDDAISLLTANRVSTLKTRHGASMSQSAPVAVPGAGQATTIDTSSIATAARFADATGVHMPSSSVKTRQYAKRKGATTQDAASTCWLDLTGSSCGDQNAEQQGHGGTDSPDISSLGWLTAPTRRGGKTMLGEWLGARRADTLALRLDDDAAREGHDVQRGGSLHRLRSFFWQDRAAPIGQQTTVHSSSAPLQSRSALRNGIWIGWGDVGFRLKLYVD